MFAASTYHKHVTGIYHQDILELSAAAAVTPVLRIDRPGEFVVSLGTSATLFGVSDKPILDPTCAICPFCDATGAWLPLICTLNCTVPAEEVIKAFGLSHSEATALAEKEAAGSSGVSFLPYLVGERTPNWPESSGAIVGLRPGG